jgi:hypothetical protein
MTNMSSDISKCTGNGCKIKEKCWRFTAPAEPLWQSYAAFDTQPVNKAAECNGFWDITPKKIPVKRRK